MSQSERPLLFIGSSSDGVPVANQLQLGLQQDFRPWVWQQGAFGVGDFTLDRLLSLSRQVDFAALCLTPDDLTDKGGRSRPSARDNVIFEAGLFMGRLGRSRTFLVCCDEPELDLPSDLLGLTMASYPVGELDWSVAIAATKIRSAMKQFRPRELYSSASGDTDRGWSADWRDHARGTVEVRREGDDAILVIERDNTDGQLVLWINAYGDGRSRSRVIRLVPLEMDSHELGVEVEVRASADCTLLTQLKAVDAPAGQYVAQKRFEVRAGDWRALEKSFRIETTAPFQVRLMQRSVKKAPSSLEVRRIRVVQSVVRG